MTVVAPVEPASLPTGLPRLGTSEAIGFSDAQGWIRREVPEDDRPSRE